MNNMDLGQLASSNAPSTVPPDSADARYAQLERTLEQFQENARHMGVIASDFTSRSQDPFNQKIHTLITGLQELDRLKHHFEDVRVPLELLDYLDQGKNPQLYTKECLERTVQKNKEVNGKIEMYKKYRALLLKELGEEVPEDTASYRYVRGEGDKSKDSKEHMSIGANLIMRPSNGVSVGLIKFVPHFVALRLSWTHNSLKSEGMEQFVEEFLPEIRANNPQVKYLLSRSYTECDPFVVGEYAWLRHRKKRVSWKSKDQVLSMVEEMAIGGDFREGLKRGVNRRLPRGQELWDTETMGHNVFEVYSKWKADPEDPDKITSQKHPQFTYRKY